MTTPRAAHRRIGPARPTGDGMSAVMRSRWLRPLARCCGYDWMTWEGYQKHLAVAHGRSGRSDCTDCTRRHQ